MSSFDPNTPSDFNDDDLGGLAWNEFDWEQYLRQQDDAVQRYLGFYELLMQSPDRLDKAARLMGWDSPPLQNSETQTPFDAPTETSGETAPQPKDDDWDAPYTIHKNYLYVATKAILLSLARNWENIAGNPNHVPQLQAVAYQASLSRTEIQAMHAIYALDFGDLTIAISLFKRSLAELNRTLSVLNDDQTPADSRALTRYRAQSLPQLFDLRELWLSMIHDCRAEMKRATESSGGDTGADE